MPKQPEPDKTPEEWDAEIVAFIAPSLSAQGLFRLGVIQRILAQGKRHERKRIVRELVEAKILFCKQRLPIRKCEHANDCRCDMCEAAGVRRRQNAILRIVTNLPITRIVNPDAEEKQDA